MGPISKLAVMTNGVTEQEQQQQAPIDLQLAGLFADNFAAEPMQNLQGEAARFASKNGTVLFSTTVPVPSAGK